MIPRFSPASRSRVLSAIALCWIAVPFGQGSAAAQELSATPAEEAVDPQQIKAAEQVEVQPRSSDAEIAERLQQILDSTGWFQSTEVRVDNGVAFWKA